jgi:cobalt transporter subunit CbtA
MISATLSPSPATDRMTRNLLTSALFAGVVTGLIAALLQFAYVIPALLEGELYESGARVHFASQGVAQSERGSPGLGGDLGRHVMTLGFNMITYVGFALILLALMALAERPGTPVTPRAGLIWGLAGFFAVQLAPAIGLPPELPGTPAADLAARQAWWLGTVLASGAGIGLIAFARGWLALLGIALIAAPQIVGAPHPADYTGTAPPELAAQFVSLSLGAAAISWAALGYLSAWFWARANA